MTSSGSVLVGFSQEQLILGIGVYCHFVSARRLSQLANHDMIAFRLHLEQPGYSHQVQDCRSDLAQGRRSNLRCAFSVTAYPVLYQVETANPKCAAKCVEGAKIIELCQQGDKLLEEEISKVYKGKKIQKGTPQGPIMF